MTKLRSNSKGSTDLGVIMKTVGLLILLLIIITAFFLGGMVLVDQVIMPAWTDLGSEVELPDVVDLDFYEAKRDLEQIGLELERIEESFDKPSGIDGGGVLGFLPQSVNDNNRRILRVLKDSLRNQDSGSSSDILEAGESHDWSIRST